MRKTAYEMRISDWSSDVCSSDLEPVLTPQDHEVATAQIIQVRLEVATVVVNRALRRLDQVIERRSFGGPGVLTHDLVAEIDCLVQLQLANVLLMPLAGQPVGRAACWESVCISVLISVVAVS